jgi:uncharacterized membrane protein
VNYGGNMVKSFPLSNVQRHVSLVHLLLFAIAIAVVLRIVNLGSREFWYDEVLSLLLSTGQRSAYETPAETPVLLSQYTALLNLPAESGLSGVLQTLRSLLKGLLRGEPHPPLLFLSQHVWLRLFGNTEAATRSLGALLSIGAIGSAYGVGRILLGHRSGLLFAALLGLNPFYLFHSLNVRMYGPLVLWTLLSAWALLELIEQHRSQNFRRFWLWSSIFVLSVAAGLLTFYLFAYWVIVLGVLILYCDRPHWWQHGLRLATGVMLTLPWALWGTIKQLRSADIKRFGANLSLWQSGLRHLQDLTQTLGTHLVFGDWVTSLPPSSVTIAGAIVLGLFIAGVMHLWRYEKRQTLVTVLLLGIFPLCLAFTVDVLTRKFTLGFGWGRTMIFALPGLLLLLVLWLEQAGDRWKVPIAISLLVFYLSFSGGDFSLRHRQVFHQIADLSQQPTLIAMNSQAWGHVMRLAYYLPTNQSTLLLAQEPDKLAPALAAAIAAESSQFSQILWLDSDRPVWSPPSTPAEKQAVEQVLQEQFQLTQTRQLKGTMPLDQFTAKLYTRSSSNK